MRAVVLNGERDVSVEEVPDAGVPGPDGLLLRVERTAICGSDLHLYHGPMTIPGVHLGHEFVGTVEDVGADVTTVAKGDRVLVSGVIGCGMCPPCRAGDVVVCLNAGMQVFGTSLELAGGQAEAVAVPAADASVVKIPEGITTEQAVLLTDILPTGYLGAQRADITPGDTVVVIGLGPGRRVRPAVRAALRAVADPGRRHGPRPPGPRRAARRRADRRDRRRHRGQGLRGHRRPRRRGGDRGRRRRPDDQRRHHVRRARRHDLGRGREPQLRLPVPDAGRADEAADVPGDARLHPHHLAGAVPARAERPAPPRGRVHPPPRACPTPPRRYRIFDAREDGVLKVLLDPTA